MSDVYTSTDTVAPLGVIQACSPVAPTGDSDAIEATIGGTAGATELAVDVPASSSVTGYAAELAIDDATELNGGTLTMRMNVSSAQMDLTWTEVYVCRVNSSGVSQEELGNSTGMAKDISAGGVFTEPITISAASAHNAGDKIYITCVFANAFTMSSRSVTITPSEDITTPFVTAAGSVELVIADATHGQAAEVPALLQANVLAVAEASHAHSADNIDLILGSVGLVVEDGTHAHAADNVDLTQANLLAVADSDHAHAADNLDLTQAAVLAVADASHGHSADNVVFNIGGVTLVVADALHGHTADNVDLLPANVLAVANALHGHSADNVDLTQAYLLAVDNALHSHEAENLTLDMSVQLIIQDALHGHSADTLALLQASTLTVADALHDHSSGNVVLVLGDGPLEIADALHGHTADGLTLSTGIVLVVADAAHGHTADSLALVQGYALLIDDGVHGHTADSLGLLQANVLTVADALHLHTADGLVLVAVGNPVELPNPLTARWAVAKRTASLLVANRTASWIQE